MLYDSYGLFFSFEQRLLSALFFGLCDWNIIGVYGSSVMQKGFLQIVNH